MPRRSKKSKSPDWLHAGAGRVAAAVAARAMARVFHPKWRMARAHAVGAWHEPRWIRCRLLNRQSETVCDDGTASPRPEARHVRGACLGRGACPG
eukprot:859036-Pleurochrysis_carterae.AAC.5